MDQFAWNAAQAILTVIVSGTFAVILTRMQLKARATLIAAGSVAATSQRLSELESVNNELQEAVTKCEEDRGEWRKACEEWERQKLSYQDDIIRRDRMINQLQTELNDVRREQSETTSKLVSLQEQFIALQNRPPRRGGQP